MDNTKDNNFHLKKVIIDLEFLIEHTKDLNRKQFEKMKCC